jgi:hypothetical protein
VVRRYVNELKTALLLGVLSAWLLRMSQIPWNFGGGPMIIRRR